MSRAHHSSPTDQTREHLLSVACKIFADHGYAGTGIQQIVDEAKVTKPTLYYYFQSKAGLFKILIMQAFDKRLETLEQALTKSSSFENKLKNVFKSSIEFALENRNLIRIAQLTCFASVGEIPTALRKLALERGKRNLSFFISLMQQGIEESFLDRSHNPIVLAHAFYGQIMLYSMILLSDTQQPPHILENQFVQLFLQGARAHKKSPKRK